MLRLIRIYLVPGAVMQSVMIGGGYGTGREITEYFTSYGMGGGLLGLGVSAGTIAVVFALSLAVAHQFRAYDYRRFSRELLGQAWFLYEIVLCVLILLVLAVITAAAGVIVADRFGLPPVFGGVLVFALVVLLIFFGRAWVTTLLTFWSVLLYAVFVTYLVAVFAYMEPTQAGARWDVTSGWAGSGLKYTLYNVSAIPVVLYAARAIETRRQAIAAGLLGGLIAVIPAVMLHLSLLMDYPAILDAQLPVYVLLGGLGMGWLEVLYIIVLLGTFIETAAGNIQGIIERIEGTLFDRGSAGLTRRAHAAIAISVMVVAILLSTIGIVDLVAEGYGTVAWGFLFFYIGPLLSIGAWKLFISAPDAKEPVTPQTGPTP